MSRTKLGPGEPPCERCIARGEAPRPGKALHDGAWVCVVCLSEAEARGAEVSDYMTRLESVDLERWAAQRQHGATAGFRDPTFVPESSPAHERYNPDIAYRHVANDAVERRRLDGWIPVRPSPCRGMTLMAIRTDMQRALRAEMSARAQAKLKQDPFDAVEAAVAGHKSISFVREHDVHNQVQRS